MTATILVVDDEPDLEALVLQKFRRQIREGTGLGLSMSHDIVVKQHGGKIDVHTEPGAFTEFIITLPRTGAAQAKP